MDPNTDTTPTFNDPLEFDLERAKLARRRKIAESLLQQPIEVIPGQMISGRYVAPNPGEYFNAAMQKVLASRDSNRLDQEEADLVKREAEMSNKMLSSIPAEGPERLQAQIQAARNPSLRDLIKMQMTGDTTAAQREMTKEEKAADRQARREDLAIKLNSEAEIKRELAGESNTLRRDLANDSNSLRREIAQQVHGKDSKEAVAERARQNDAKDVLDLLDQATPLIPVATSSGIGALVDKAGNLVGKSSASGDAAAQLRSIEGMLVSKMPKMSGPQSDKDVLLYRQMAGQIGDPNVPVSQKQAAVKTIREINERYSNPDIQRTQSGASGSWDNAIVVRNRAEWQALSPGQAYVTPQGARGIR